MILTLPEEVPPIQRDNEQVFLEEAGAFFEARRIELETFPLRELQSMWDDKYYDCILLRYALYLQRGRPMDERKTLAVLGRHLTADGRLYVLEHNRLGMRALAGDRFDGTGKEAGLVYNELMTAASYAGLHAGFYFPHPFMEGMDYLFSEDRPPGGEKLALSLEENTPRLELFDEGELLEAAAAAGTFPRMANQLLCVAAKQEETARLLFCEYPLRRKEWCAVVRSEYRMADGQIAIVRRAETEAGTEHVKQIMTAYMNMDTLYKGYTLQIAPCRLEQMRILSMQPVGKSLEALLDEAIDREWKEGFFRWIDQLFDIMTTPVRIAVLDGSAKRQKLFSQDSRFVEWFGELSPQEDALFDEDPVLPYTPVCCRFGDFFIEDRRWLLQEYEWTVTFPVPFSYVCYHAITSYFEGREDRNFGGTLRSETLKKFGITKRRERVFARMLEHFNDFIKGEAPDPAVLLEQKKRSGTFLPVGEWVNVFNLHHGQLSRERQQELEEIGGGFAGSLRSVWNRIFG